MEKNVLFAGKEYPDGRDFATVATNHNRKAVITVESIPGGLKDGALSDGIYPALWSRNSPLASRSLMVQAESICEKLHEAVIIFDTSWYSSHFTEMTPESCSRAVDRMIACYAYLVTEILSRFRRKGGGTLVFVVKRASTTANGGFIKPISILAAMAEGAFKSLGESVAMTYAQEAQVNIVLSVADYGTADTHFANWLFEVLDDTNSIVGKIDPKRGPQWFRMGDKTGKAGLFHRPQKK